MRKTILNYQLNNKENKMAVTIRRSHFYVENYFWFFSKSLISFKSFTSAGSAGGGAGFDSSFFLKLLKNFTTRKRTNAVIKKLIIA